jgi:hypothetical protein
MTVRILPHDILAERAWEPCVDHDDIEKAVLDGLESYEDLFRGVLPNGKLPVGRPAD